MTLALARKYRPRTFTEVVGQDHVVRAFTNALERNRLHHAYLLTGTRGVGKTTLARIIAKALNCETGVTATPCGVCAACREIDGGRFVDLIEIDAASNTGVDNMRELLENALYAPTAGRYKVYLIDEVHMLSRGAFNAMLKTLEEPPGHVKFILATTDPQKIPVTVLSRCLQFALKQIPPPVIRDQLARVLGQEQITAETAALELIARAAAGSMRDSLSLLDQAIAFGDGRVQEESVRTMLGAVDRGYLYALLDAVLNRDGAAVTGQADALEARGLSFESALADLAGLLHRIAVLQAVPESVAEDDPDHEALRRLAAALTPEDVQLFYQIALRGRADLPLAPDEYAGFSMTLLRMMAFRMAEAEGTPRSAVPASPSRSAAVAPPSRASGPATAPAAAARAAIRETPPVVSPVPNTSAAASARVTAREPAHFDATSWPETVAQLKLGGMARMLAQHCAFERFDGDRLQLRVPEAHKHLVEPAYREKLRTAVEERFGPLRIEIAVGDAVGDTLAAKEVRDRETRQVQATEAIEQDPFVRDLVENFDARVVDGSIRPVD
ncbi:MAG: DNA polymerase III subunit gamma/tau [Burkholderiales bacterium]|nr:DNA polymerase III subunit gamma/tau [Burkholderiales bacterium]